MDAPVHGRPSLAKQMTLRCSYEDIMTAMTMCVWLDIEAKCTYQNLTKLSITLARHAPPYMDIGNGCVGCKSLDLHYFEWILRRDILTPGKAQMEDLVLGSVLGQQRWRSF